MCTNQAGKPRLLLAWNDGKLKTKLRNKKITPFLTFVESHLLSFSFHSPHAPTLASSILTLRLCNGSYSLLKRGVEHSMLTLLHRACAIATMQ